MHQRMATTRKMRLLLLEIGALLFGAQKFSSVFAEISPSLLSSPLDAAVTVSCFGPTCSGKSTLLSDLFDTSSAQTISDDKGIFISYDESKKVAIIEADIDDSGPSEDALIAVGGSDIIMYNILLSSLSRDGLSGLKPLLEEVCELHSKGQFKTGENLKKFVLVVRDIDSVATKKLLEEKIPVLIKQVWDDVAKPLKTSTVAFEELFDLDMAFLPKNSESTFPLVVQELSMELVEVEEDIGTVTKRFQQLEKKKTLKKELPDMSIVEATTAVNNVIKETLSIYEELSLSLNADAEVNENFGVECEEIISDMLGYFDESVSEIKSPVVSSKRKALLNQMLRDMQDKHFLQLAKLQEAAFMVFRKKLAGVRVTATVADDMEEALNEADKYFVTVAKKLRNKYADFVSEGAQQKLRKTMQEFSTERLQQAKLQGSYLISKDRKPVAISFNWLLSHPFGADARRTSFLERPRPSYATYDRVENMATPLEETLVNEAQVQFRDGRNVPARGMDNEINPNHPVFRGYKQPEKRKDLDI